MAQEFTPSVNYSMHQAMPDTTSSLVSDVAGGVVATVADIGASLWNSLPLTPEVDTADLLKGINANALRVYEENPDTIHTASFIGGMFVPVGLSIKGLAAMRAGVKGVNWFNKAGRDADISAINKLFEAGKSGTDEYRTAMRGFYGRSAINQAIDAVAAEAALITMMNKHPYMEDYLDDPVRNFSVGVVAGGVLGAGIGHVADRFLVNAGVSVFAAKALDDTLGKMTLPTSDMTGALTLQRHRLNLLSLDNILAEGATVGKTFANDLTMQTAENLKAQTILLEKATFDAIVSQDMLKLNITDLNVYLHEVATRPEMFGVDKIAFIDKNLMASGKFIKSKGSILEDKPVLKKIETNPDTLLSVTKGVKAYFFPNIGKNGSYGTKDSVVHFAGAAAKYDKVADLRGTIAKDAHLVPSIDNTFDLMSQSAADAQASYIAWMDKAINMDEKTFNRTLIGNADNVALTAMLHVMRTKPEMLGKKLRVQDKSQLYNAILNQQVVTSGAAPEAYVLKTQKIINESRLRKRDDINILTDSGTTGKALDLIRHWKQGPGVWEMHLGATSFFARGYSAVGKKQAILANAFPAEVKAAEEAFEEVYNSASSKRGRAEFSKLADKDGFIYLYRGIKNKEIRGASPVESMTTNYQKAQEFSGLGGRIDLYKIHPEDIVAIFNDFQGHGGADVTEILVRSSARHPEATLDAKGKITYRAQQALNTASIKPPSDIHLVDAAGVAQLIRIQKANHIDSLIANGIPAESIAIKTNTPVQLVEAYTAASVKGEGALADIIYLIKSSLPGMDPTTGNAIASMKEAEALLNLKNKPLLLEGNLKKNPYIEGHANLTNKQMADMNSMFVDQIMLNSKSQAVREMGFFFNENSRMMDMLNQALSNATMPAAGSRFINSFDFYARNMKDLGPAISGIAKAREKISNDMIERVAKPIQNAMETVSKDPVAVVEFNTFKTVNDSLKNWRSVDATGRLVQRELVEDASGVPRMIPKYVEYQGKPYRVTTPAVRDLIAEIQKQSVELREMHNAVRKIKGVGPINDIGLWIPPFNPMNKYIAYVWNKELDTTQLLWARSSEALATTVADYRAMLLKNGDTNTSIVTNPNDGNTKIISKGNEQELWSILNGRMDPLTMTVADTNMLKTGSASSAVVPNGLGVFGEIIGGYEHYITAQMRNVVDVSMSDSMFMLDRMSVLNKITEKNQPLGVIKRLANNPKDPALVMKSTLLGDGLLGEYGGWKWGNSIFELGLMQGQKIYNSVFHGAVEPLLKGVFKNKTLSVEAIQKLDYEKLSKELTARGVPNPWAMFDEAASKQMHLRSLEESADTSKRIVYAGNALAATVILRVGELAQPLVNIMSLPILTYLAKAQQQPEIFLGIQKNGGKIPNAAQVMFEGARAANSPMWDALNTRWEKMGYFQPMISEANKTLHMSRAMDRGAIAATEKALDSRIVEWLSKPADISEAFVRRQTMFTGAVLAKHLYPSLDDAGITVFARDFMDKAVGNFHASQRPVFFQGTLGVALGLFQTYSLTLGQSVYRHLELGNYKLLGKAALLQGGIFGTGSLPGFAAVSNQIGEHFSDDHVDLVTGSYRSLADPLAETLLYGLPSQLGVGTHTRGDVNPRFPGLTGDSVVALNFAKQSVEMVQNVARALGEADSSVPRAVAEALSLQSLSRPIARGAEILTGYSKTGKGNTVQVPDEVWTLAGVGARILGTRPIMETKLRDAMHLNSYYHAADSDRRQTVIDSIQTKIRNGTLSDEDISEGAEKYLGTGGTPTGWRSAINTAIGKTETSGRETLLDKLKPNSPLGLMIDDLD